MNRIPTSEGLKHPEEIVDSLTFASYRHNRRLGITPAGFRLMGFPNVDAHESRFQLERITQMRDAVQASKQPTR